MRNRKRLFCFFMAVFMLLAGLGFENAKISAYFACNTSDISSDTINSGSRITADEAIVSSDMTDLRTVSQLKQVKVRNTYCRRSMRLSYVAFSMVTGSQLHTYSSKTVRRLALAEPYSQTVVLNYIHNTDGKKKI